MSAGSRHRGPQPLLPDGGRLPASLLVVQTAFLGDLVLTLPLLDALADRPEVERVGVVVNAANRAVLDEDPRVHQVYAYAKRGDDAGLAGLLRTARALRADRWEAALLPHRSLRSSALALLAGIRRRIGFESTPGALLYSHRVQRELEYHEGARNLLLAGDWALEEASTRPRLNPPSSAVAEVDRWLDELDVLDSPSDTLVAIAPGSVWETKRWPREHWTELARGLVRAGITVVVIGGPDDLALGQAIEADLTGGVRSAAGALSVVGSAELIRRCRLLVTGDTAPLHLASAMGTPIIALFGPTVEEFGFGPTGPGDRVLGLDLECRPCSIHGTRQCPLGHHRCMRWLAPRYVLEQALELLDRRKETTRPQTKGTEGE